MQAFAGTVGHLKIHWCMEACLAVEHADQSGGKEAWAQAHCALKEEASADAHSALREEASVVVHSALRTVVDEEPLVAQLGQNCAEEDLQRTDRHLADVLPGGIEAE